MKSTLERIHNIDHKFNKKFSPILFIFGGFITLLIMILPYFGRIFLALLINVFFNRGVVYLNYIAQYLVKPLQFLKLLFLYFIFMAPFSILYKALHRPLESWDSNCSNTCKKNMKYQS